jgi:DNA-binding MarR family transcriptional regulator
MSAQNAQHKTVKPDTSSKLNLQRFLPYRLAVVARAISNELAERYSRDCGISIPEWRVIGHLAEVSTCSSGEICQRTAMDKATVNRAVTRLVAAGLILADVSKKDRRLNVLALSAAGKAIHRVIVPLALDVEAQLLDALDASERDILFRAVEKLGVRIEKVRRDREDGIKSRTPRPASPAKAPKKGLPRR